MMFEYKEGPLKNDSWQNQIDALEQRVAALEERIVKKDWIVELPGLDGGPSEMYRLSGFLNVMRLSIRNLESVTARPHTTLDKLKYDIEELQKKCVLEQPLRKHAEWLNNNQPDRKEVIKVINSYLDSVTIRGTIYPKDDDCIS